MVCAIPSGGKLFVKKNVFKCKRENVSHSTFGLMATFHHKILRKKVRGSAKPGSTMGGDEDSMQGDSWQEMFVLPGFFSCFGFPLHRFDLMPNASLCLESFVERAAARCGTALVAEPCPQFNCQCNITIAFVTSEVF